MYQEDRYLSSLPTVPLVLHDIHVAVPDSLRLDTGALSILLYGEVPLDAMKYARRFLAPVPEESADKEVRRLDFVAVETLASVCSVPTPNGQVVEKVHHISGTVACFDAFVKRDGVCEIGDVFLMHEARAAFIRLADRIAVVYETTGPATTKLVMWAVREMHARFLENAGYLGLHAAALVAGGDGLVLLGPSGTGKTTLLLRLLGATLRPTSFLCNDRVLVDAATGQLRYSPLPIRISAGTAARWTRLHDWMRAGHRPFRPAAFDIAGLQEHGNIERWERTNTKLELDPHEISSISGSGLCAAHCLRGFIVPQFQLGCRETRLRTVSECELLSMLIAELRTPFDNVWPEPWLEPRRDITYAETLAALARLAQFPAIRLTFGPDTDIDLELVELFIKTKTKLCVT